MNYSAHNIMFSIKILKIWSVIKNICVETEVLKNKLNLRKILFKNNFFNTIIFDTFVKLFW